LIAKVNPTPTGLSSADHSAEGDVVLDVVRVEIVRVERRGVDVVPDV